MKLKHLNYITAAVLMCLLFIPSRFSLLFRFLSMLGFSLLAVCHFVRRNAWRGLVFSVLALLFQPFVVLVFSFQLQCLLSVAVCVYLIDIATRTHLVR